MITIKALSLAAAGGGWMDLEFSKNIVLENCHYLTYPAVPLDFSVFGLTGSSLTTKIFFSGGFCPKHLDTVV